MALNKKLLKQQAYKRIPRPISKSNNAGTKVMGKPTIHHDTHQIKQMDHGTNLLHLTITHSPVGCGVWKYGKYLQPAKKTVKYVKQAHLVVGMVPVANPSSVDDAVQADQTHSIEFTGIIEPLTETSPQMFNRWLSDGKLDIEELLGSGLLNSQWYRSDPGRCSMVGDCIPVREDEAPNSIK